MMSQPVKLLRTSQLVAALSLLPLASLTFATENEATPFSEEDIFFEIPQVTSATNILQKLTEAPAAITIIDQNIIEASGALNIPDLLRLVPGMQVFHVHSNKMGATYHGMTDDFPSRMEVMINGRSIYIPLLSTVVWEAIGLSVDDIDHIEVVRGSNVPTQGSNAFLGAINIITKSPISQSGTSLKGTVGALGTQNYTARHSGQSGSLQYALSIGSLTNDGIDFYNDAGRSRYLSFSGSVTPNFSDTVTFDLGMTEGYAYRGEGNKSDLIQANFSPREHSSNYQDIRWNRILENQAELQVRYTHNYLHLETDNFTAEELAAYENLPVEIAALLIEANDGIAPRDNERGKVETHNIGIQFKFSPSATLKAVTGSNFRYDRAKSDVLLQNADNDWVDETNWMVFGNIEYHAIDRVTLNAGTMFEESSIAGGAVSYRAALNYALNDLSTIRAAYSNAHRMPSLLEANSAYSVNLLGPVDIYTQPNRTMKPEEMNSFEIGYFSVLPQYSSQIEVRAFYEDVSDAMVRGKKLSADDADGDYNITMNNAEWTNQGIEAQFKFESSGAYHNSLLLNYSFNDVDNGNWNRGYYPPETNRMVSLDAVAPQHTASILLSTRPTPGSLVSLAHYYMDHVEWLEGYHDRISGRTNYTRTDLKLSNTYSLDSNSELKLSLIIQNLFDKEYIEFYANNIFERRTYIQAEVAF